MVSRQRQYGRQEQGGASVGTALKVALCIGLGYAIAAEAGPMISAAIILVVVAASYVGQRERPHPAVPFLTAGWVLGVVWYALTHMEAVVTISALSN